MENVAVKSSVLNDLIQINNDRIAGYEKAIGELDEKDADLHALFRDMIAESRQYCTDLAAQVQTTGETVDTGTTTIGKIYRAWMDVKAFFGGNDRKTVLSNCEGGEDAAQKAYASAEEMEDLPADTHMLISRQRQQLKLSHDKIKALRDAE